MDEHQFTTIRIADILDALIDAVESVRASTAPTAWQNAVTSAYDWLLQQDVISYDVTNWAIKVESATRPGRVYVANGACGCEAFTKGAGVCWHRAAARLVRRAIERQEAAELTALAAELVSDAAEAGATWYTGADALAGARSRMPALADVAADWDRGVAAQRADLGARLATARARVIAQAA